jgi:RimJ/RimL family protein N-acetyltransferase
MHPITNKALQTERMVLRLMEMADVDDLMGLFSDPVAMRYYPSTKSRQEAEEWVRRVQESYRDRGFGLWVAVLEDSGEFVGQCGLTVQEVEGKNEVEIALPPAASPKRSASRWRRRSRSGARGSASTQYAKEVWRRSVRVEASRRARP